MTRNVWLGCELRQPPCTTKPGVQNPRQRSEEEEEACISSVKLAHSTIPRVERRKKLGCLVARWQTPIYWQWQSFSYLEQLGTWLLVLGTWLLVLGTCAWYLVVGAWYLLVLGTCSECSPLLLVTYQ